ncbi:MAG: hypothetical protein U5S82_17595 [Gammaproteobacteria bacterium]|nr:hypothetical protein [Gammaproteobacteria bacterium]
MYQQVLTEAPWIDVIARGEGANIMVNIAVLEAKKRGGLVSLARRGILALRAATVFGRLYLLPVKHNETPGQVRMAPAW